MRGFFLLFILLPVVELWLLLAVGDELGAWATLGLILLTTILGVNVLRYQGVSTLTRVRKRLDSGEPAGQELIGGFLLALGGLLLLLPGFLTDGIGLLLVLPPTRRLLAAWLLRSGRVEGWQSGSMHTSFHFRAGQRPPPGRGEILEGELDPEPEPRDRHLPPG